MTRLTPCWFSNVLIPKVLIPLVGTGFIVGCTQQTESYWSGYAEGDYVYVASPLAGRLDAIAVSAGQSVAQGAPLFTVDSESEQLAQREAAARLKTAQAQSNNLDTGKRQDEIAVTRAQLEQARAAEVLAMHDLQRQQQLVAQGFVSKALVEDATSKLAQARARVAELSAAQQVAELPARSAEREAQRAAVQAAQESLKQSEWRTRQKQQAAPQSAVVADVFYQTGEFVTAGQPVVSLLPPGNIKVRFFVPESDVATVRAGQSVQIACDGCGASMIGQISRVATQPEFTPPVIYSNAQRSKLVFMVEAKPQANDASRLKPGQPLQVRPAPASIAQGK